MSSLFRTGAPIVPDDEIDRDELREPRRYTFEVHRREFLRIFSATGAGLLVIARVSDAASQESGRAGAAPQEDDGDLSAWIHVDEQGRVTAFTGKTEIGQNIRTSLTHTVADELRVALSAVTFVMADTDLVPYDRGTFGSRTTPFMAPQLARAAATARDMLIDRAAQRLKIARARLDAVDGTVRAPGGQSISYGELVKGQKLAGVVPSAAPTAPPSAWRGRGQAVKKVGGRDFVTGAHTFTPDMTRPNMLHGVVVRPPAHGALLVSVDAAQARVIPGAIVVRDGGFVGVVAPSERLAHRAAAALQCDWKERAGQLSSDTLYEHLQAAGGGSNTRSGADPFVQGSVETAKKSAARSFEATYRIPYIAHVPLEPRAALAEWVDGKLTVWTGTQRPFGVREELMETFRLAEHQVRVIVPDTGSAYGGKHTGEAAVEAARLAKAVRRPVRLVWTRGEEFAWGYLRPAGVIEVKASVDESGRLVSWEFDNWNSGRAAIRCPYDVPNQRIAFHPSESPLRQGSYRGLAATANNYVREMHIDAIARALRVDPIAFRLKHLTDERLRAVLVAAAEKGGWAGKLPAGRARGIACGTEKGSYVAACAELSAADGGFRLEKLVVAFECGAIVNPDGLRNQVEGCVVQGIGGALFEAIEFAGGRLLNGSMAQYRVPRFKDVPELEIALLDRRDLPSAGAGETPIISVAPAIGSAARAFGPVRSGLPVKMGA
jgi:isoquinoline 1-oxidoreductase